MQQNRDFLKVMSSVPCLTSQCLLQLPRYRKQPNYHSADYAPTHRHRIRISLHLGGKNLSIKLSIPVFLNHRAVARYQALASIILGRERFSWKSSF